MPSPFYRQLSVTSPLMTGSDVVILQHLLARALQPVNMTFDGVYGVSTASFVQKFVSSQCSGADNDSSAPPDVFNAAAATCLLRLHLEDNYVDPDPLHVPAPYLYKVYIEVHANRSIETEAQLVDNQRNVLLRFTVRTHGQNNDAGQDINQLSSDGNTPSGLMEFDLNSPESNHTAFGPYPINRVVQGLAGNAAFLLLNSHATIRSGILMHTGEWPNWAPPDTMPNSHGCVHGWPSAIKSVWQILVNKLGVQVRPNLEGTVLPYPYQPQGLLSIVTI